jgi:two-component system nitrate/nitrite response regulator NarL
VTARRQVELRAEETLGRLASTGQTRSAGALTPRESEVLRLLACGSSNRGIADTLGISATTVRNHIEHVLSKLGVHSKLEAVVLAAREHLV